MHRAILTRPPQTKPRQVKYRPPNLRAEPQETPLRLKVSSGSSLHDRDLSVQLLQAMLRRELEYGVYEDIFNLPIAIFPDSLFPHAISKTLELLTSPNDHIASAAPSPDPYRAMYNKSTSRWIGWPDLSKPSQQGDRESELCSFLNDLGSRIAAANLGRAATLFTGTEHPIPAARVWVSSFHGKPLPGRFGKRKPDLVLFDRSTPTSKYHWDLALSTLSLKSNVDAFRAAKDDLTDHAFHTFAHQDSRRFIISVSICNTRASLSLHDRAGVAHSLHIDAHSNPEQFLRIFCGIMIGADQDIGFDPTIKEVGGKRVIEAGGLDYSIESVEFISGVIQGRGTVCWHVTRDGQHFAIKDIWSDETREFTEAEILKSCEEIEDIPKVIWAGKVQINGEVDRTENWRSRFAHDTVLSRAWRSHAVQAGDVTRDKRVHRRIVLTPYASPITSFQSKRELLQAFIDITRGK